jgi:NADH-quinone oxidoreductase subunit C
VTVGEAILVRLRAQLPDAVLGTHERLGDATATVAPERVLEVLAYLREEGSLAFDVLADLTAVDHLGRRDAVERGAAPRFEVVYHLYSIEKNHRVRIKAGLTEEACEIDSAVGLWPAADWLEREVYDMYGIRFRGHPDLRRLLLYPEFEGHPLRKDYPKTRRQPLIGPQN